MDKLIPFVAEQWVLISALISCLLLLSFHEQRRAGKALTPQQVVKLVNQQGAVWIDLRDKGGVIKGHILDSVRLPLYKPSPV